jgi:hypothetical protein
MELKLFRIPAKKSLMAQILGLSRAKLHKEPVLSRRNQKALLKASLTTVLEYDSEES